MGTAAASRRHADQGRRAGGLTPGPWVVYDRRHQRRTAAGADSGVTGAGAGAAPIIRSAARTSSRARPRSSATASATRARISASARRRRSSSTSAGGVAGGVVSGTTRSGVTVSGGVVRSSRPAATSDGIGMRHPPEESGMHPSNRPDTRARRMVAVDTPQRRAASACESVGGVPWGVMTRACHRVAGCRG